VSEKFGKAKTGKADLGQRQATLPPPNKNLRWCKEEEEPEAWERKNPRT